MGRTGVSENSEEAYYLLFAFWWQGAMESLALQAASFLVVNITTFDLWMELLSIPGRERGG